MINVMVESSITLVNSWSEKIEKEGGVAEIKIDSHMRSFSGDVISKACFGSNYAKGQEIFLKLRALQELISKIAFTSTIPGFRYLPTKSNREIWKLEREVQSLILKVVKERKEATSEKDLLQMILEGTKNSGEPGRGDVMDHFVVDNCKNIYLAGYETTAVAASWTLMLLALNPGWQAKVREEVMQLLRGGQYPDADMIRKMKTLTMVINESLRLYPPVAVVSREALEDMKLGNIQVPKGVNVWTLTATLHQDPNIWGPDADRFDPERFANGVTGACKLQYAYMPFGVGPRTCLGQNFAMAELKVLLALIISNFSFSISPKYRHSPALRLVIEPEFGVDLLVRRL
ncbi:cytochrome P450 714C2-like [Syzygium oleosum]|uniref:cytochrome P450 714C2-like n=1 Tax=Syzygium oleosum TaxID=219896 RepID=UPI0024B92365|nr:cytochrome P450 714C2-like [Syzygium oleosum]